MIPLKELLSEFGAASSDVVVRGITMDSRCVSKGDLFCACPGDRHDGRDYIDAAISAGAAAVIYESQGDDRIKARLPQVPVLPVKNLRQCIGKIAARFYGQPSQSLTVIGVTGTNGKTSCVLLLAQALEQLGSHCGVIGTLGTGFVGDLQAGVHTTPDAISVQRALRELLDRGASHVALEVSSHALDQGRVNGVSFDAAVFTNLSHDHLDYHGDLANYGAAKARLFAAPNLRAAIVNGDDPFTAQISQSTTAGRVYTFGHHTGDIKIEQVRTEESGLGVDLATPQGPISLTTGLLGRINADNLAAVTGTLLALGHGPVPVSAAIRSVQPVPGRMELFQGGLRLPHVVVDYAHTPDALERALSSVRDHCHGHLWCLFGCGGDRDRAKRSAMGEIARRLADHVIVTNDNPRSEDPRTIAEEIIAGMSNRPIVIHDRARAIDWSITLALPEDWVLVAGKGHETTQQIGDQFLPHDDRHLVQGLMRVAA